MRYQDPTTPDERKRAFYAGLGRFASANKETRNTVGLKDIDAWRIMFPGMFPDVTSAISVSETSAQRLSAVFTCLNVIGETIGSLPFDWKQNTEKGPMSAPGPIHRLIHDRPNPYMTAFTFWSAMAKLRLAWGNAYAEITERDIYNRPTRLDLRLPWEVTIMKTPSGEIFYTHKGRKISHTDMIHLKNYSLDGICGISTIRQNALTIGLGLKLNSYNQSIIGDRPYGYLTAPSRPKDLNQKKNIQDMWNKPEGDTGEGKVGSLGKIPLLYGGVEFKAFTLPADDVAYIESAKLTNQDIYGMFRVPPTLAQNYEKAPYNSSEQQDIVFSKYSLQSIKDIEQEVTEKCGSEYNKVASNNYYSKFNLNGLMRGDTEARKDFYSMLLSFGVLTPKMIAQLEDLDSTNVPDIRLINSTLMPLDQLKEWIDSKIQKNLSPSPGTGNNDNNDGEDNNQREAIMAEIREMLKPRLNGKWSEIEPLLR
jgi:HK97 family phage portal protein